MLKGIKPTETTCFHTIFRTLTFHRHLFYIPYIVFHQIYSNCIITKCKSLQWIAYNYTLFSEKVWGRVCMFLNCTARSSVAKATCQVATRHLGAATESTYVPCPANLFLPATASPPVFVLVSYRFPSHFPGCSFDVEWLSSLPQSCHFYSLFHSNCVLWVLWVQNTHVEVRMTGYLVSRLVVV